MASSPTGSADNEFSKSFKIEKCKHLFPAAVFVTIESSAQSCACSVTWKLLKQEVAGGFYNMWMANAFKRMDRHFFSICGG